MDGFSNVGIASGIQALLSLHTGFKSLCHFVRSLMLTRDHLPSRASTIELHELQTINAVDGLNYK